MSDDAVLEIAHFVGANVTAVLAVRALPFAGYALTQRAFPFRTRTLALGTYTALVVLLCAFGPGFRAQFAEVVVGAGYFTLMALMFHAVRGLVQRGHLGKLATLSASAIAFQLIPALFLRGPGAAIVHVVGWELALSSYSYCVDPASVTQKPRVRDAVFFILVDPVLVFAERGCPLSGARDRTHVARYCALGLAGIVMQVILVALTARWPTNSGAAFEAGGLFGWAAYCGLQFSIVYAGLAGVANFQCGLMRSIGYTVPDRFNWPILARSPAEFWERWNTYVASWFYRYVFISVARAKQLVPSMSIRYALSTVATFLAVGLAHQYALLLQYGEARGAPTLVFLLAAAIVLAWKATVRSLKSRVAPTYARTTSGAIAEHIVTRLVFVPLFLTLAWLAIPALSGEGLPGSTPLTAVQVVPH